MGSDGVIGWLETTWQGGLRGPFRVVALRAQRTLELLLAQWCFDALPSEEPSVDRPPARSEHRQRGGNGSCQTGPPTGCSSTRQDLRDLDQRRPPLQPRASIGPRREEAPPGERRGAECDVQRRIAPQPRAACQRTTAPTTRRISSKPMPGQPPANVEYRRRNTYLDTIIRRGGAARTPRRGGGCDSFGSVATGSAGATGTATAR